jgi:hypothetical protein
VETAESPLNNTTGFTTVTASCPSGTFAVSGGYEENNANPTSPGVIAQSFPVGGSATSAPTGWEVTNFGGTQGTQGGTLTTFVICSS